MKEREKWKMEREKSRVGDPSVVKAREEFERAKGEGDLGKMVEAVERLREAQIFQIRRLR